MRKYLTMLTILLLVLFMVGCEKSINPINSDNPATSIGQSENSAKIAVMPFGSEVQNIVAKKGHKGPKPPKSNKWHVPGDFNTIQEANDAAQVLDGDIIIVAPGDYAGAYITKQLNIRGHKNDDDEDDDDEDDDDNEDDVNNITRITSGPELGNYGLYQGFRFFAGSDGSKIKNLTFTTDFGIMNNDGSDNIEISHCKFLNTIQGISAWGGSGWKIKHNEIINLRTRNGGGIGILSGARWGGIIEKNEIKNNKIYGTLNVWANDGGGYAGSGIVFFADFRWGWPGADEIKNNKVEHNKISLVSDNPSVVDVVGCELTDPRNDESLIIIFDNKIKKNDFRGTITPMVFTPITLEAANDISKNKVD